MSEDINKFGSKVNMDYSDVPLVMSNSQAEKFFNEEPTIIFKNDKVIKVSSNGELQIIYNKTGATMCQ